ncbi:MAG: HD-GYP domain-containing protein [Phycisphaerales bacterium]
MIPALSNPIRADIDGTFRARCDQLGLALWWLRADGTVVRAPEAPQRLIEPDVLTALAESWSAEPAPGPVVSDGGVWLFPIPIVERRALEGYLVATFASVTANHAAPPDRVSQLHQMLVWMFSDLRESSGAQADLDSMVEQLTNAYETFHAVYGVGRAMGQIEEPDRFVQGLVDELGVTLPFAWLYCVTADSATGDQSVDGQAFVHGSFPGSADDLQLLLASLRDAESESRRDATIVMPTPAELASVIGPQIVGQPVCVNGRHIATLVAGGRLGAEPEATSNETMLLEATGGFLGAFLENTGLYVEQEQAFIGTIKAMTSAIDAKDRYTQGHSVRVAKLSRRIARAAGLDAKLIEQIYISGLVHDVGKIGVPEAVLTKAGRLTDAEFEIIKRHPDIGHGILSGIPSLTPILPGVLHHHEKWDGSGYPRGLAGEDIPLMARVIGLADTFDAMSSTRSYRAAMPRERVLAEIERCAGSQFDPELAALMPTLDLREFDRLVAEHSATDAPPVLRAA